MKRISVHAVFAVLALGAASLCAVQALRLHRLNGLDAAIVSASVAPVDADAAAGLRDAPPEVRLARATALSKAGAFDAAFKSYSSLIEAGAADAVGRHALYNLGNMYLRQGLAASHKLADASAAAPLTASAEAAPLIELAKQRYRDLLRIDADDWDARYNLERALRLAPEEHESVAEEANTNVERRGVMLRGMDQGDLP